MNSYRAEMGATVRRASALAVEEQAKKQLSRAATAVETTGFESGRFALVLEPSATRLAKGGLDRLGLSDAISRLKQMASAVDDSADDDDDDDD